MSATNNTDISKLYQNGNVIELTNDDVEKDLEAAFEELEKNKVALCLVEGKWIPREVMLEAIARPTADFSYLRFMGERDLTSFEKVVRPQDTNLEIWHTELSKLKTAHNFIYFSNFYEGHAPESARKLMKLFGQDIIETESLENQGTLF